MDETRAALIREKMEHTFGIMGVETDALRVQQTQNWKLAGRRIYPSGKSWPEKKARVRSNSDGMHNSIIGHGVLD